MISFVDRFIPRRWHNRRSKTTSPLSSTSGHSRHSSSDLSYTFDPTPSHSYSSSMNNRKRRSIIRLLPKQWSLSISSYKGQYKTRDNGMASKIEIDDMTFAPVEQNLLTQCIQSALTTPGHPNDKKRWSMDMLDFHWNDQNSKTPHGWNQYLTPFLLQQQYQQRQEEEAQQQQQQQQLAVCHSHSKRKLTTKIANYISPPPSCGYRLLSSIPEIESQVNLDKQLVP
ncbi:uncharacterized protein BYT42DRAFT_614354 [Radiomyces spectabilis]|uniref:uncharacterized protein n=1 Tax=Radiomyces spectabilis TaxID=64574 RepID=UPI00221F88D2|nr:uncharacterized protein BYT42DRAFT_614354 [Radiomyces spectabilis]KAI8377692.1 hypothetical protein BYT42DRAFT_614354 [Radiomyces spectabilis]